MVVIHNATLLEDFFAVSRAQQAPGYEGQRSPGWGYRTPGFGGEAALENGNETVRAVRTL